MTTTVTSYLLLSSYQCDGFNVAAGARCSGAELDASCAFYRRLAVLMAIPDPPTSYAEAEQILDTYEKQHLAPSGAGRHLMKVTQDIVVRKLPKPIRRYGPILTSSLLDQPNLGDALGLPRPNHIVGGLLWCGFSVRNSLQRMRRAARHPWFQPGRTVSHLYPDGYALSDLGPANTDVPERTRGPLSPSP